uniref:Small ribosomal subunit protein uS11c n=1 Tax=Pseudocodium devriesii TaxID=453070 RepID=A0A386B120_9CHLO|nr:ribosomal protein S11 [Pseudocodium devriesii]AYC65396.1 ribosomal protein S11 [Pseudocodium devriesii]
MYIFLKNRPSSASAFVLQAAQKTSSLQTDRLIIHIKATFNNTILTLTNFQGQVLTWASAGSCGFKGARKGTPFAAKKVVEVFLKKSMDSFWRCSQIKIYVCGIGPGRESALRGFEKIGESTPGRKFPNKILLIREITKIPHNGCRPPKKRRL